LTEVVEVDLDADLDAEPGAESNSSSDRLAAQLFASPSTLALLLLERAKRESKKILLFVDQFEELVTLVADPEVRRRFLQAVCTAADDADGPVRVIFTVRDDFLSRLAEVDEARQALSQVTVLQSPAPPALAEILARPLAAVGYAFDDPELIGRMVAAVHGEPVSLPLVQFALGMLWAERDQEKHLLTTLAYDAMGGIAGALATHADQVLQGLSETELQLARDLLLRLVTAEGTRRVLTRRQALAGLPTEATGVLALLTGSRLVSTRRSQSGGEAELELAHESLIRSWTRLARWLDESKEELVFLQEIGQAAELWERRGRRAE
jgi:hypothetical protein